VLLSPGLVTQRGDVNDRVCPGVLVGVVCLVVPVLVLDRGAGQLRARSEISVTIDDHNVTHCPKGNADPCTRPGSSPSVSWRGWRIGVDSRSRERTALSAKDDQGW
jgi:hypothetical protein